MRRLDDRRIVYVRTSEDSFLTRNRNMGDIVIFGPVIMSILAVLWALLR